MLKRIKSATLPACVDELAESSLERLVARRVLLMLKTPEERYCYLCNLYFSFKLRNKSASRPEGYYRCRFCRSKDIKLVDIQMRSADESTDVFVVCLKCNRRSKVS